MDFAVTAWNDAPYFSDAERAALALSEAITRLNDRSDPVADEIWNEATRTSMRMNWPGSFYESP
jgi:alkylhydroperoxidase family enzyme